MPTLTEIKYSQLENRFDSGYYKPEYLEVEDKLENTKFVTLLKNVVKKSSKIFDPSKNITDYFYYIEIDGINLVDGNFSFAKLKNHEAPLRARKKLEYGDTLISTVRPNRNAVSLFLEKSNNYVCSTGFCVIKSEKINPYFLFIFLKTKYSVYQLIRNTSAAMYPAVSEDDILNIKIIDPPKQFQLHIEDLVKKAFSKKNLADQKYKQAKQLLEKELGINKLKLKEEKTFETKFSEVEKSMSFSSEYYKPKFTENLNLIKSLPHKKMKLEDIIKTIKYGTSEKLDYTDKGTAFLRVTDIDSFNNINVDEVKRIPNYELPKVKNAIVKKDDILISRTGTVGVAVYINDELNNSVFGSYFIKISIDKKEVNPFYLTIFLNSKMGRLQSERSRTGAIQTNLTIPIIKSLEMVVPSIEVQERICKEYLESFDLRKESKALLNSARQEIGEMIENVPWK